MEELKIKDIEKLDKTRILAKVSDSRRELFDLRMKQTTSGIDKPHVKKVLRKNIARLLTVYNRNV
jgi:large subunit ribosomal protein L29